MQIDARDTAILSVSCRNGCIYSCKELPVLLATNTSASKDRNSLECTTKHPIDPNIIVNFQH